MSYPIPPPLSFGNETSYPYTPPPLVLKSDNTMYNNQSSPQTSEFVSPPHTPHGSPSKHKPPPGAHDLPGIFQNALRIAPPEVELVSATNWQQSSPTSPTKRDAHRPNDKYEEHAIGLDESENSNSSVNPIRTSNKENTSPGARPMLMKDSSFVTHAAASRREPYKLREQIEPSQRLTNQKGFTKEELEKLQKPSVRRLANVTQLYFFDYYYDLLSYVHSRQTRASQFKAQNPLPPATPEAEYNAALNKYLGRERANLRKRRTRLKHGDFQILTQVGQGGYGQVYLAQKKDTREVCALKVMSKKLLFKLDEIRHVLTERDILTSAKSEWLVRLLYAFQDDKSIYLAMEYVPGGDFRTLLNNAGVLHNRHARFYISEMFMCVDALHQLGYTHRDLKPENFLVDSNGHVKLTDFGLAAGFLAPAKIESMRVKLEEVGKLAASSNRPVEERSMAERRNGYRSLREREVNFAKSVVGSPDYMAPEVLKGDEYNFTVDYWSLGCMLFEALAGYPPFSGSTVDETWQNLKHWEKVLQKPIYEDPNYFLSKRTWNLIKRLIASRQSRFQNFAEIQAHPYFAEVDWVRLREQRAPFVPELDGETDPGYFDDFSNEADMAKYKEVHEKQTALENMADREDKMGKGLFVGFTFRHRKPTTDEYSHSSSPRKPIIQNEDAFGTIF